MAARTLLQQAVPTTFGYKAAGWLAGLLEARERLQGLRLPAQLGGAAGTLAAFGERGPDVLARSRPSSSSPSRSSRGTRDGRRSRSSQPRSRLAAAAAGKIGLDVVLLAQTEVGEVREAAGGGSSTMPHKRNPVRAVLARACARGGARAHVARARRRRARARARRRARGRPSGARSPEALALTGGALAAARESLAGLEVDTARMRANMSDELYSEQRAFGLEGDYLGSAPAFVDRVLEAWRSEGSNG